MEQLSLLAQAANGRAILIIDSNQLQEKAAVRLELDGVADAGVPPRPRRTASGNVPQIHGEIERRLTEHSDVVKTLEAALGQKNAELEHLGRMSEETHNALEARITDLEGQLARAKTMQVRLKATVEEAEHRAEHFEARATALQDVLVAFTPNASPAPRDL